MDSIHKAVAGLVVVKYRHAYPSSDGIMVGIGRDAAPILPYVRSLCPDTSCIEGYPTSIRASDHSVDFVFGANVASDETYAQELPRVAYEVRRVLRPSGCFFSVMERDLAAMEKLFDAFHEEGFDYTESLLRKPFERQVPVRDGDSFSRRENVVQYPRM